jgi:hypothetical protein
MVESIGDIVFETGGRIAAYTYMHKVPTMIADWKSSPVSFLKKL